MCKETAAPDKDCEGGTVHAIVGLGREGSYGMDGSRMDGCLHDSLRCEVYINLAMAYHECQ
jgi:hypothetical protein